MPFIRLDLGQLEDELGAAAQEVAVEFATELVNQLKEEAPVGAQGDLRDSFQIFFTDENVVWLGTRIHYAEGVWKGTPPHTPNFDDIKIWARRKLGDESAAGAVYRKIQAEGTDENDYVGRAIDNTLERVGQFQLDDFS